MWHVSSRSGVATLRTAIHLLLTYTCLKISLVTNYGTVSRHICYVYRTHPKKIIKNANNVHPTSFPGYLAELWWCSKHGTTPFNDFIAEVAKQYPVH